MDKPSIFFLNNFFMENDLNREPGTINIKQRKTLLEEYFMYELRDLLGAEQQLKSAMPVWKNAAGSQELSNSIEEHIIHTEQHIQRLEMVFEMMGEKARAKKCEAMDGLIREADTVLAETSPDSATRDVALIMAIQKAEHYEIATYGGLITLARTIGQDDVAEILKHTMAEEKEMDELLSGLAENNINEEASTEWSAN
jgi:ferritin-like metal-binding protein YciE